MKTKFFFIISLFAMILFTGCCLDLVDHSGHHSFVVANNGERDIYFYLNGNYPDTSNYHLLSWVCHNPGSTRVPAKTTKSCMFDELYPWETNFKHWQDTIIFFIMDAEKADSIDNTGYYYNHIWASPDSIKIFERKKINDITVLKRYYYTIKDLDSLNWTITYP